MHLLINKSRTDAFYLHSGARFCLNVLYKRSLQVYNVSKMNGHYDDRGQTNGWPNDFRSDVKVPY